jgi:hypothetical protein
LSSQRRCSAGLNQAEIVAFETEIVAFETEIVAFETEIVAFETEKEFQIPEVGVSESLISAVTQQLPGISELMRQTCLTPRGRFVAR